MTETKAVHVRIEGQVQRVWYRAWTVERATARGLRGWVRNCSDGTVEAAFSGPAAEVDAMVAECHEGSPKSSVSAVTVEETEDPGWTGFEQRATA